MTKEPISDTTKIANPTPSTLKINYLALGDSYTKAEGISSDKSYPALLSFKLIDNQVVVNPQRTIAQTGWRTDNLSDAITNAALLDTFDLVSLQVGVNNQYQGKSASEYRVEFRALLEKAIYFARGREDKVFVLSIPDYGATPFGASNEIQIGQQIDQFNAINKEITDSLNVLYIDITPISRRAKTDASLLAPDNLHPSGKMYALWVDLFYDQVLALITKQ